MTCASLTCRAWRGPWPCPEGWQYKAARLKQDLTITTDGVANIVPDNLANMYQGCIDGVNNFDPWY
jgi:hypothetical protein